MFQNIVDHRLFPEGKAAKLKAYKQSDKHKTVHPSLYADLEAIEHVNRPGWIISELRANKLAAKQISSDNISIVDRQEHVFRVRRKVNTKQREHTVNIKQGYCNCHYFMLKRIPCPDMYAVLRNVTEYSFQSLPSQLINDKHMIINVTATNTANTPNTPNVSNIDDVDITLNVSDIIPNLDNIPRSKSNAYINKQYKKSLRDEVAKITQAIYRLDMDKVQQLRTQSIDPLTLSKQLLANVIHVFPVNEYGMREFTPIRSYESQTNNTQRINAEFAAIPHKQPTEPQQRVKNRLREKRETQQLKKRPPAALPPQIWEAQEIEKQNMREQRRQKVIAQREKEREAIPEYMEVNVKSNHNTTNESDDNNRNKKYRSSRNIKPSQRMIESMQYQNNREKAMTLRDEVCSDDDEDYDIN